MKTTRALEKHDLVLFAINTGELYQSHCLMARKAMPDLIWRDWLANRVIPLYSKQIEGVVCDYETICNAASEIKEYYERHVTE